MTVQTKFHVKEEAEEVDQQLVKFKIVVTEAAVEQIQEPEGNQNKSG